MSAVAEDLYRMGSEIISGDWYFSKNTIEEDLIAFLMTLSITKSSGCLHISISRLLSNDFVATIKVWPSCLYDLEQKIIEHFGPNLVRFERHAWTRIIQQIKV